MTSPNPAFDDAWTMMQAILQQWNLDSLSDAVRDMLTAGDSTEVIPLKLRQTEQYKARFSGNLLRQKAGLPALSESEYLGTEATYKSILRQYVGSGSYDSKDQLDKFFGSNVSPAELNNRMQEHAEFYQSKPQRVKDAWAAAGLTPADAIRTTLDPTVTETDLKRRLAAFSISAEAFSAYGDYQINQDRLLDLADRGVTDTDAGKAFREVASRADEDKLIAGRSGIDLSTEDLEDELLVGDADATQKRRSAYQQEKGRFEQNYLGTQQGALGKDAGGRY